MELFAPHQTHFPVDGDAALLNKNLCLSARFGGAAPLSSAWSGMVSVLTVTAFIIHILTGSRR